MTLTSRARAPYSYISNMNKIILWYSQDSEGCDIVRRLRVEHDRSSEHLWLPVPKGETRNYARNIISHAVTAPGQLKRKNLVKNYPLKRPLHSRNNPQDLRVGGQGS